MLLKRIAVAGFVIAMSVFAVPFSSHAKEEIGPGVTPIAIDNGEPGWVRLSDGSWKYRNIDYNFVASTSFVIDGYTYLFNADGIMVTDWWSRDDGASGWYYFYKKKNADGKPEGAMALDTTIDGYYINSNGLYVGEGAQLARNVLDQIGWDLQAAFNWSAGLKYYRFDADPAWGVSYFANYGFTNNYGNCYVMAATFCEMARLLGYDARQMTGLVPSRRGSLVPHSWCELNINGQMRVFDPNFTNETGKNGYNIIYGMSGTWRYQSYSIMNN